MHHDQTVEYIEVTLDDIAVANRLACEVLGRSVDELPPQTRRLLGLVDEMVTTACQRLGIDRADYRFSRRDIREFTGWGHTQLKVHLKRLEELEYLLGPSWRPWAVVRLRTALRAAARRPEPIPCPADRRGAVAAGSTTPTGRGRRARSRAVVGAKSASSRAEVGPGNRRKC